MKYIIITAVIFLSSCATMSDKITKVQRGMSKDEVANILGAPESTTNNQFKYYNRRNSNWSWDTANYYVNFDKDNKAWDYGQWGQQRRAPVAPQPASTGTPAPTSTQCTTFNNGLGQLQTNCDSN